MFTKFCSTRKPDLQSVGAADALQEWSEYSISTSVRDVRERAYVQFDGRIGSEEASLTRQKHWPRLSWLCFEEVEGIKLQTQASND